MNMNENINVDEAKGLIQLEAFTTTIDALVQKYIFTDMHQLVSNQPHDYLVDLDLVNDKMKRILKELKAKQDEG